MNNHSTGVKELNAVLDQMVRDWICIINLDAEFCFTYNDDDPNPYTSTITGFQADVTKHAVLIQDLRTVCLYVDQGSDLNFAKLTSLCDVAGSLQPAVSLIKRKMPGLVA